MYCDLRSGAQVIKTAEQHMLSSEKWNITMFKSVSFKDGDAS